MMASNDVEQMEVLSGEEEVAASSSKAENVPESAGASSTEVNSRPICMIVLGMAGSGKTSFVQRLTQLGNLQNMKPYVINLDPACQEVPYHANIGKNCLFNTPEMCSFDIQILSDEH